MEHRHGRARPDLLWRRQQGVCVPVARRNTYAYRYRHCNIYSSAHGDSNSYRNSDVNAYCNCYRNGDSDGHANSNGLLLRLRQHQ